ncbi:MAG: MarR family winged helix-turn-helix transcriptional regulator [Phycisphaerales bacterium]
MSIPPDSPRNLDPAPPPEHEPDPGILDRGIAAPDAFGPPAEQAWRAIARTHALLNRESALLLRGHGLSPPLYQVLRAVHDGPAEGTRSQSIGRQLFDFEPDVTRLVDRLERDRLIQRRRDPNDRRVVLVRITDEGRARLAELAPRIDELHARQFGHLSDDQLTDLVEALAHVRERPRPSTPA